MSRPSMELVQRTTLRHAARGGVIDWALPATEIAAVVEAAMEAGGHARTSVNGQAVQIVAARAGGIRSAYAPGTLIRCDEEAWIQAGEGHVVVERVRDGTGAEADAPTTFLAQGIAAGHCFDLPPRLRATRAA